VLTDDEVNAAIAKLRESGDVSRLLTLNDVRNCPRRALRRDYQRLFDGYYRVRQQSEKFYVAFYRLLFLIAAQRRTPRLQDLMKTMYCATRKRHLSFCSKLLATVSDEAVIFDRNVAGFFRIGTGPLPKKGWMAAAVRRCSDVATNIKRFVARPAWPNHRSLFDQAFPDAAQLSDIRKADLIIWAHVALQTARAKRRCLCDFEDRAT
jgi:hypothetical protein